jgi:hypothetical protein
MELQPVLYYSARMGERFLIAFIAAAALATVPAFADGLPVDPSKVKPEFRVAAEKRAAEQKKLAACQHEAQEKSFRRATALIFLSTAWTNS